MTGGNPLFVMLSKFTLALCLPLRKSKSRTPEGRRRRSLEHAQQRPASSAVELLLIDRAVLVRVRRLEAIGCHRLIFGFIEGLVLIAVGLGHLRGRHDPT